MKIRNSRAELELKVILLQNSILESNLVIQRLTLGTRTPFGCGVGSMLPVGLEPPPPTRGLCHYYGGQGHLRFACKLRMKHHGAASTLPHTHPRGAHTPRASPSHATHHVTNRGKRSRRYRRKPMPRRPSHSAIWVKKGTHTGFPPQIGSVGVPYHGGSSRFKDFPTDTYGVD